MVNEWMVNGECVPDSDLQKAMCRGGFRAQPSINQHQSNPAP